MPKGFTIFDEEIEYEELYPRKNARPPASRASLVKNYAGLLRNLPPPPLPPRSPSPAPAPAPPPAPAAPGMPVFISAVRQVNNTTELNNMRAELETCRTECAARVAQLEGVIVEKNTSLANEKSEREIAQAQIQDLQRFCEGRVAELNTALQQLQAGNAELTQQQTETQARLVTYQQQIAAGGMASEAALAVVNTQLQAKDEELALVRQQAETNAQLQVTASEQERARLEAYYRQVIAFLKEYANAAFAHEQHRINALHQLVEDTANARDRAVQFTHQLIEQGHNLQQLLQSREQQQASQQAIVTIQNNAHQAQLQGLQQQVQQLQNYATHVRLQIQEGGAKREQALQIASEERGVRIEEISLNEGELQQNLDRANEQIRVLEEQLARMQAEVRRENAENAVLNNIMDPVPVQEPIVVQREAVPVVDEPAAIAPPQLEAPPVQPQIEAPPVQPQIEAPPVQPQVEAPPAQLRIEAPSQMNALVRSTNQHREVQLAAQRLRHGLPIRGQWDRRPPPMAVVPRMRRDMTPYRRASQDRDRAVVRLSATQARLNAERAAAEQRRIEH